MRPRKTNGPASSVSFADLSLSKSEARDLARARSSLGGISFREGELTMSYEVLRPFFRFFPRTISCTDHLKCIIYKQRLSLVLVQVGQFQRKPHRQTEAVIYIIVGQLIDFALSALSSS